MTTPIEDATASDIPRPLGPMLMRLLRTLTYAGIGYGAYKAYRGWRTRSADGTSPPRRRMGMGRTGSL